MPNSKNHNSWIKRNYPRKCPQCEYVANNPSMFSYHKRTHDVVTDGKLCDHGCGQLANYRNTNGKYTCEKIAHHCPEYIRKHSQMVAEQWQRPDSTLRKEETKRSLVKRLHNPETVKKATKTKREKFGTLDPEKAKEYRRYARFVRQRAQMWAKAQGYKIGLTTYHVDHKLSILDAWQLGLPEEIVNHPENLQIIDARLNSSKGARSSLTVEQLLEKINPSSLSG